MRKIFVIARREYRASVRSKAFLISLILMPILMGGGIIAQSVLRGRVDLDDRKIVVIDGTGKLFGDLADAAEQRNKAEIYDPEKHKQVEAKYVLLSQAGPATDELRISLSDQVRSRAIAAYVEIDSGVLDNPDAASRPIVKFHSESITSSDLNRWFSFAFNRIVHTKRLQGAGINPLVVRAAMSPVEVEPFGLYSRTASGEIRPAEEGSREIAFFVPIGVMMLMFMSLMMSQTLLSTALEEKQQRIAEVVLGSASPFQLMLGKLLGNVGVSLTIVAIYLIGGFYTANHYGFADMLPARIVIWFLIFQVLGVLLYGSIFIAIGAACTDLKEAQNLLMPVMLILVLPMMVWINVLKDPTGSFATWLSLFPPATPMLMILRIATTGAIPMWQPFAGILSVLLGALFCVFAAGRVFRIGILSQGKAPRLPELVRWVISG